MMMMWRRFPPGEVAGLDVESLLVLRKERYVEVERGVRSRLRGSPVFGISKVVLRSREVR